MEAQAAHPLFSAQLISILFDGRTIHRRSSSLLISALLFRTAGGKEAHFPWGAWRSSGAFSWLGAMIKLQNGAGRFGDCPEICVTVEVAHHHLHCYRMAGRVILGMQFFGNFN